MGSDSWHRSIAVSVANLKLAKETRTAKVPVIIGIGLMVVTVLLLVYYQAVHASGALLFAVGAYSATAVLFFGFALG